jgi:hypothetical protein
MDKLIGELVEVLEQAREKLQLECGGSREYKGGVPTQFLFPRIDEVLKKAKGQTIVTVNTGKGAMPLTKNGKALTAGDLEAGKMYEYNRKTGELL